MSTQKQKIAEFISIAGANKNVATKLLKESDWDMERALDNFYTQNQAISSKPYNSALFDHYKDDDNIIGPTGTEKLCMDLEVDPSDVVTICLSWHMKCPTMCEFTKEGFKDGCLELGVETLDQLKATIPRMRQEIIDPVTAKQIYIFTFNFAKVENQKNLSLETAIAFWDLLLAERFKYLEEWKHFLIEKHGKAISRDTWNLFWDFAMNLTDFSAHDTDGILALIIGAWPLLIDSFVEHMRTNPSMQ